MTSPWTSHIFAAESYVTEVVKRRRAGLAELVAFVGNITAVELETAVVFCHVPSHVESHMFLESPSTDTSAQIEALRMLSEDPKIQANSVAKILGPNPTKLYQL